MKNDFLSGHLEGPSPIRLTSANLAVVLETARVLREEETRNAGTLRVSDLDGTPSIQKENPDRGILLRPRPSVEEAMAFVDRRFRAHERVWDG